MIPYYKQAVALAFREDRVLGIVLAQIGRYAQAIEYFEKGLKLDPQSQSIRKHLDDVYRQMKDQGTFLSSKEQ